MTVRCLGCGLVYQPKPPDLGELNRYYDCHYHEHWFDSGVAEAKRATYAYFLKMIPLPKPGETPRYLDIGCALGHSLEAAQNLGYEAWGVEYAQDLAQNLHSRWGSRVSIGDFLEVPLPSASFQTITMIDAIEHFTDPLAALQRCCALLKEGGRLIVATPDYNSLLRKILRTRWEQFKQEHVFYFSYENLAQAVLKAGLEPRQRGLFWKKLELGYLLNTVRRYDPWLVPAFLPNAVRRFAWLGRLQFWLPTDGFVLVAQKPA